MKKVFLLSGSLILVLVLLGVGLWFWLNAAVTQGFIQGIGGYLRAQTTVDDVHLDLFSGKIVADDLTLLNLDPAASWNDVQIGHAEARFHLADVFAKKTPATIEISDVKLRLAAPANQELSLSPETPAPGSSSEKPKSSWPRIEIRQFALHHGSIIGDAHHPFEVGSLEITSEITPGTTDWTGQLKCQLLTVYSLKFGACTAHFSSTDTDLVVDNYQLSLGDGAISGHATLPKDVQQSAQIHFDIASVPTSLLIPPTWNLILSGVVRGTGDYTGVLSGDHLGRCKGHVELLPADLAIPFLSKLATVPGLNVLTHVSLDTAKTDFVYDQGTLSLSNLRLEKSGTIVLTGDLAILPDQQLGGALKLGLPTALVSVMPKLKEEVFVTDAEDYSWADVKVSGTSDHIVEDLSPRIAGAIGDQGKQMLQDAVKGAGDLFNSLIGK